MRAIGLLALGTAALVAASQAGAGTLDDVKKRGSLLCGVTTGLAGFAAPNDKGEWAGFDVDVCRAVAAAVFGDATKVKYVPTTAVSRFPALQSGEVDMLSRNTTWTYDRDVKLGFDFVQVAFYDGQGFMVRKSLNVKSALQLNGATVCVQTGSTTELNLADYFRANKMNYKPVVYEKADEIRVVYDQGRCDAYTTDRSGLAAQRTQMSKPDDHVVLPEVISKEPLGPLVRHGDNQWGDVVRWAFNVMIIAEEKGITAANVDQIKASSQDPEVRRLLGVEGDFGTRVGLENDWPYKVIKQVGNYGESYERNVGPKTPIGLERGVNALWSNGGLVYAPPYR